VTRLRNYCIRGVDYVQCISLYTRERLRQAGYPERMLRMIPNAVQTERFRASSAVRDPAAVPTVIFVGRIQPVKGLEVLLRAWKMVLARLPARLLIAGDGGQLPELKRFAADTGIAESVTFTGEVSDVPARLEQADLYVQPSYQEGLPNSVLEAMSAGLPIVATRISGNEDVVADGVNGMLVPAGDAESLAHALATLLADRERAREFGRQSRRIIEQRFQLSAVVDQLVTTYRRES
jgi:glycosyltransferase involved in cell wall biosynthesis